jgi:hypothetical protein
LDRLVVDDWRTWSIHAHVHPRSFREPTKTRVFEAANSEARGQQANNTAPRREGQAGTVVTNNSTSPRLQRPLEREGDPT